ncbi:MAG: roadblock/LC7 domain-containing protein [Gemmatimonadetes bacterium]|nr:roadblock/LC7 domain-containing protein [Gemmatimonadota bacterium]
MKQASAEDLRRWSEEVARDAGSLAFIPLAEAYRRQGRDDEALRVCLRGLERHPSNVEAHAGLARIYLSRKDKEKAFDEWLLISKLDPEHFETRRGLGFGYLERGALADAVRHLSKAAELRRDDQTVREALALARGQLGTAQQLAPKQESAAQAASTQRVRPVPESTGRAAAATSTPRATTAGPRLGPESLFATLVETPGLRGIVLLDSDGLLLAGRMSDSGLESAEAVASILSGAIDEATRTAAHLDIGGWEGILLETEDVKAYLQPVGDALLLVAGEGRSPLGWLRRVAGDARDAAAAFLAGDRG